MQVAGYSIVRAAYGRRFYWRPKKLTLWIDPPIYRWGYWNICRVNVNLDGWE